MKINKKIIGVLLYVVLMLGIGLVVYSSYQMGYVYGGISGIAGASKMYNHSICETLNMTQEGDACIFPTESEYASTLECPYGTFIVKGEKTMNGFQKLISIPQRLIFYPALRCKFID